LIRGADGYKFIKHDLSSKLDATLSVPFTVFEKYYDVKNIDNEGKYKAWLLGIERYTAEKRIHHFVPFSTVHMEKPSKRAE
jgi:hypothetical protein